MASENRIKLTDPNGNTHMASTPVEVTNLVFGSGYKLAEKGMSVDAAVAKLADSGPVAEQLSAAQNPSVAPASESAKK